ncbi:hypothetical protein SAMN05421780_104169 [Flexibacter flexilis DSM 6793]|uniref:Outer membrane protein beta-barrel domain-containing protein n=2 Tax=Flexibacter flexilis TaxID=998 RepID=A0A1I1I2J6_9BACT|nr:hypothetical protein SAMN05421780_104169 [Flexibacter flexilis DSM 6793]
MSLICFFINFQPIIIMKKVLVFILLLSLGLTAAQAQKKSTKKKSTSSSSSSGNGKPWGLGLKFGEPFGLTLKHYTGGNAWDLTLGRSFRSRRHDDYYYRSGGLSATFTYQWTKNVSDVQGLGWYYGLGAQVASRSYYKRYNNGWYYDDYETRIALGAVGVLGMEYTFDEVPLSVFLEATPYVELTPATLWIDLNGSIGGRFRF